MSAVTMMPGEAILAKIERAHADLDALPKDAEHAGEIRELHQRLVGLYAEAHMAGVSVPSGPHYPTEAHRRFHELCEERRRLSDLPQHREANEPRERELTAEIDRLAVEIRAWDEAQAAATKAAEESARNTPQARHERALAELEAKRRALALRATDGDKRALTQLERVEAEIVEEKRTFELWRLAEEERERLAAEAEAEARAAEERERQEQVQALDDARKAALQPVLTALGDLRATLPGLVAANREWEAVARDTSDAFRRDRTERHISELSRIVLLDAGLNRWDVPEPPSARERMQLLDMYEIPEPDAAPNEEPNSSG